MNEETYEALKLVLKHATEGGPNDAEFWDAVKQVEGWIDEVAKEYEEELRCCENCQSTKDVELYDACVHETGVEIDVFLCKECVNGNL